MVILTVSFVVWLQSPNVGSGNLPSTAVIQSAQDSTSPSINRTTVATNPTNTNSSPLVAKGEYLPDDEIRRNLYCVGEEDRKVKLGLVTNKYGWTRPELESKFK